MGACRDSLASMGTYGDPWGPRAYGDLWGPMGTYGDLWVPIAAYPHL